MTPRRALMFASMLAAATLPACARAEGPPADVAHLERAVGLHLAHERDSESADANRLRKISEAEKLDAAAEKEIAAGDYKSATRDLLDADAILRELDR